MKDSPLSVRLENNQLVISIGINTLAFASSWENGGPVENLEIKKGFEQKWAEAVERGINEAALHALLDGAIMNASQEFVT